MIDHCITSVLIFFIEIFFNISFRYIIEWFLLGMGEQFWFGSDSNSMCKNNQWKQTLYIIIYDLIYKCIYLIKYNKKKKVGVLRAQP